MTGAVAASPFLKWVGGKRRLLPHLLDALPEEWRNGTAAGTYYEPFLGGGALYFALQPPRAVLSDSNVRLMRAYAGVRDDVEEVVRVLRSMPHNKETYQTVRASDVDRYASNAQVAAWMIYLNKTCFNGLYRVNKKGEFNVPFGSMKNPAICNEPCLRAASVALRGPGRLLSTGGFSDTARCAMGAVAGDLVYFDPPYVPLSGGKSFVSYTSSGFGPEEQKKLRDVALALKRRGVRVLLTNSATPEVRELYGADFHIIEVAVNRTVGGRGSDRTVQAQEVIIR